MGTFGDVTDVFELMVNWKKRLANKSPFYRKVIGAAGNKRVLDMACGLGHHAAMRADWGMEAEGADLSDVMIDKARQEFGDRVTWVVRSYDVPVVAGSFDAAYCAGNSFALAGSMEVMRAGVANMMRAVRPGGVVMVHLLNLWSLAEGPISWKRCVATAMGGKNVVLARGVHRCGKRGFVDVVICDPASGEMDSRTVELMGIEATELERMMREGGAKSVRVYGSYQEEAYVREGSVDMILVGEK